MQKTQIGFWALFGMTAIFFSDYLDSAFGKKNFPGRHAGVAPEQILELFFKTIGVVKDCLQGFSPNLYWDESVMCDSGKTSEGPFGRDRNLFLLISFFAIAGKTGFAFKGNKTEEGDASLNRPYSRSGIVPLNRYPTYRSQVPVGSPNRSPLKQTGLYEKGDCYQ